MEREAGSSRALRSVGLVALNGDELADVRNSAMSGKDDVPLAPAVTAPSSGTG